jgi:hypothetical protein
VLVGLGVPPVLETTVSRLDPDAFWPDVKVTTTESLYVPGSSTATN